MKKKFSREKIAELIKIAVEANLDGLEFLKRFSIEEIQEGFNGIGPEFLNAAAREKISEKLDIFLAAAMIHDMRNDVSDGTREAFLYANDEFRRNCIKLADYNYGFFDRKRYRMRLIGEVLYLFVSADCFGWKAWMDAWHKNLEERKNNLPEASAEGEIQN